MSSVKIQRSGNEIPVSTIVNLNGGTPLKFWVGTLQQYNDTVGSSPDPNTVYLLQQTTS